MEKSRCIDCKVEIGGLDHRPVKGFNVLALQYVFLGHLGFKQTGNALNGYSNYNNSKIPDNQLDN